MPAKFDDQLHAHSCSNIGAFTNDKAPITPSSWLLLFLVGFCCLTGVLLGYDLCLVSTILEPIKQDFELCPAQIIIQPSSLNEDAGLPDLSQTSFPRRLEPRRLEPRGCFLCSPTRRSLGVDSPSFNACATGQFFVAIISPGAAFGSLVSGPFSDAAGRLLTLALADFLIMIGTLLMSFASRVFWLFCGRFILGVGIGVGFVIFSTYITECAPEHLRGRMVSSIEVAQCVGCLASFAVTGIAGSSHWRYLLLAAASVAGLQLVGIGLLPESPRWYIRKNKPLKAEDALRALAGLPKLELTVESLQRPPQSEKVQLREESVRLTLHRIINEYQKRYQLDGSDDRSDDSSYVRLSSQQLCPMNSMTTAPSSIEMTSNEETSSNDTPSCETPTNDLATNLRDKWHNRCWHGKRRDIKTTTMQECRRHYRQILIAVACAVCQNLTGSTAVLYYSTEIFSLGGVQNPQLGGVFIGIAKVCGILVMILLIERVGRRRFLLLGTLGIFFCYIGLAVCFGVAMRGAPIVTIMFLLLLCQNISWAGLMFVVASEVLPSSVRGIGMAFTISTFWLLAFLSQSSMETLMELLSIPGVFVFYASASFVALAMTYMWIPDFGGHSLEQITEHFEQRKAARRAKSSAF